MLKLSYVKHSLELRSTQVFSMEELLLGLDQQLKDTYKLTQMAVTLFSPDKTALSQEVEMAWLSFGSLARLVLLKQNSST